jgi:hypothetical protein
MLFIVTVVHRSLKFNNGNKIVILYHKLKTPVHHIQGKQSTYF